MLYLFHLIGLLRFSVLISSWRAYSAGFHGNFKGDGTLLGSSLVVGPGDAGILYEHHSEEFGDHADMVAVRKAVERMP